jgi:hypothetical protein
MTNAARISGSETRPIHSSHARSSTGAVCSRRCSAPWQSSNRICPRTPLGESAQMARREHEIDRLKVKD